MKAAVLFVALLAPGLSLAASLTGSIVESSATVNLPAVGTLDWARWPGYTHRSNAISNVTTTGTLKSYTNDPRLIGDRSGIKVAGGSASFVFTVAATTTERTLTYYIGGWNSTGRVTISLPGAAAYVRTFTSTTNFSRVVTVRFRADTATKLTVRYEQTAGPGSINMQAAALAGVAAPATSGSMALTWQPPALNTDGTPLTDLTAFRIHWGTTEGSYPNSVRVGNGTTRAHTVTGLAPGTWYFVVTALNAAGVESARSNVARKTVP